MPLTQGLWKFSAASGSKSTIVISADHTTIQGVFYAGSAVTLISDMSFAIDILPKDNLLVVILSSPGPNADRVQVYENVGDKFNLLDDFMVDDLTDTWQPTITGV